MKALGIDCSTPISFSIRAPVETRRNAAVDPELRGLFNDRLKKEQIEKRRW